MKKEKAGLKEEGIWGNGSIKSHADCPVTYIGTLSLLMYFCLFVALTRERQCSV